MDATARCAVIDKADLRNGVRTELARLNATIFDRADSAAGWSFAGHDEIFVIRHRKKA
jgi:hypothetical protein